MSNCSATAPTTPIGTPNTLARAAVLVVLALVAATAVWLGTRGNDTSETSGSSEGNHGAASDTQTGPSSSIEQVAPQDAQAAPPGGVFLPTGTSQSDGYPTGFGHTDLGAVALQAELAKAQIGFDYDQAAAVARLYSAPEDQAVLEARSRGAVALRRQQAGVAAEGAVPPPASYALTPMAYTLQELDTDYYAVNLLSYVTLTTAQGESRDGLYAGTQLVQWVADGDGEGDWKVVEGSAADVQRLVDEGQPPAVAPSTAEFEQAGWIKINPARGATGGATGGADS